MLCPPPPSPHCPSPWHPHTVVYVCRLCMYVLGLIPPPSFSSTNCAAAVPAAQWSLPVSLVPLSMPGFYWGWAFTLRASLNLTHGALGATWRPGPRACHGPDSSMCLAASWISPQHSWHPQLPQAPSAQAQDNNSDSHPFLLHLHSPLRASASSPVKWG